MTDGSERIELWCPTCFTPVADLDICPNCGMAGQQRTEAARLREVVARISQVTHTRLELDRELNDLADERRRLLLALRGADPRTPIRTDPTATRAEWRPERVRDVLLWLGAILLTIAAITFAAVAWTRLGPAGRAGILLAITGAAAGLTAFVRPRLRPTAEALGALTIALALVDWGIARRTGLRGGLSDSAWWAIGLALIAVACTVVADRIDLTAVRLGAVTLAPAAATFALATWDPSDPVVVVGLAALTSAVVVLQARLRGPWTVVEPWMTFLIVAGGLATLVGAVIGAVDTWADPERVGAAIAVLAVGLPPLTRLLVSRSDHDVDAGLMTGLMTLAGFGAAATLASGTVPDRWILAGLAGGSVVVVLLSPVAAARYRPGLRGAALVALIPAGASVVLDVQAAWLQAARQLADPWTGALSDPVHRRVARHATINVDDFGPALFVLACLAVLAGTGALGRSRATRVLGTGIAATLALTVVVAAVDPTIGVALAAHVVVATLIMVSAIILDRNDPATAASLVAVAIIAALPAVGWAAVTPTASLVALAVVITLGAFGAVTFRTPPLRVGAAVIAGIALLVGVGLVLADRGTGSGAIGFVIVATAAGVLVVTRSVSWTTAAQPVAIAMEALGLVGAAVGTAIAGDRPTWRLLAFALMTPVLLLSARRIDDRSDGYAWAALAVGALGGLAGLASGRIPSEWITVPAALLAVGVTVLPRFKVAASWPRLGGPLLLGFVTSVGIAINRGNGWRVLILVVVATAVLAIGARTRQSAPIVVSAAALLILGVDGAAPYAAEVPRWVLIGTAGVLALWAGATADRRLEQLRRWRQSLDQFT